MITVRNYVPDDWAKIPDPVESFMPAEPEAGFQGRALDGIAVTAEEDGDVLAIGGVSLDGSYEGVVWLKVSQKCEKRPISSLRCIYDTFQIIKDSVDCTHISTFILDGFEKGAKLAKLVGLQECSETREYNGNTYRKYMAVI
jgi:hypothetical protein